MDRNPAERFGFPRADGAFYGSAFRRAAIHFRLTKQTRRTTTGACRLRPVAHVGPVCRRNAGNEGQGRRHSWPMPIAGFRAAANAGRHGRYIVAAPPWRAANRRTDAGEFFGQGQLVDWKVVPIEGTLGTP